MWRRWVSYRASKFPYVWPNHREFIERGFHHAGTSAVLVLPTGAGKTTVSALKIAAVLSAKKRVIFLAPTHALVEQLIDDLGAMFPKDLIGAHVSSDFDLPPSEASAPAIEVMTPEGCLASLCYAPKRFDDVGLLVFDECHLLSPSGGKIRRAIDGMLCVLAFVVTAPEADLLFLSAMLQNGADLAAWLEELTGRQCLSIDLLWKPSRQARGVIAFKKHDIDSALSNAKRIQSDLDSHHRKKAKNLRTGARIALHARPHAIWGLQHNWLDLAGKKHQFSIAPLLSRDVTFGAKYTGRTLRALPNVNSVAATIAADAARYGLKTIVFVNNKSHAVSTAREISRQLTHNIEATEAEKERWSALAEELGSLDHSLLERPSPAVPHNGLMLRLERDLAERMFRRPGGASVIVATPTLAQGLNLPAQLAVLAGDKRSDADSGRSELEAHEILNAAARAGRAGHLANGVVLLVPDPLLEMRVDATLPKEVASKLQAVLPEDDRCIVVVDPLQAVLDRISSAQLDDSDVQYVINRVAARQDAEVGTGDGVIFPIRRSFAAFCAARASEQERFNQSVQEMELAVALAGEGSDASISMLASQSGLPMALLSRLRARIESQLGGLPTTVLGWTEWMITWLQGDDQAANWLLGDVTRSVNAALGRAKDAPLAAGGLSTLLPAIEAWLHGLPVAEIETLLGGRPANGTESERTCPRARELIGAVMPRGMAYAMGLVTQTALQLGAIDHQDDLSRAVLECLGVAVRRGYDRPQKVNFAIRHPELLSRVQVHRQFHAEEIDF